MTPPRLAPVALASALAFALAGLVGCGGDDDPVDAAGAYSLSLTSGANGCEFPDWEEGNTAIGVPFTITQDGNQVTGTVGGVAAAYLDLVLGGHVLTGEVDGDSLELELFGTRQGTQDDCSYTINAVVDATLDGDVIEGSLRYRPATNGSPSCGVLDGCESVQAFNGTRPPGS